MIRVRAATEKDLPGLLEIAREMRAVHEHGYFERCLAEQEEKKREIWVAEDGGRLLGYAQLVWSPLYPLFRRLDMPEIQDLNVIPEARCQGLGARLVDACEARAAAAGKTEVGISVGLSGSYGAAQRLYIKKGYVPDGAGACYDDAPLTEERVQAMFLQRVPISDTCLTLKLVKSIRSDVDAGTAAGV